MTTDEVVTSLIYLTCVFLVLVLGKIAFSFFHKKIHLHDELIKHNNLAVAFVLAGYFLGLTFVLGGLLSGPSQYWLEDVIDIFYYGTLGVLLLNMGRWINDKVILHAINNTKEIVEDRNIGMGVIEGASHIANGLILGGALSGQGGSLATALIFWIAGQLSLIIGCRLYELITPFKVLEAIERDNIAVGVAFSGIILAIGNIARTAVTGDFLNWHSNGLDSVSILVFGLLLLPLVRFLTDYLILPGVKLSDEIIAEDRKHPNVGVGIIEACSYILASLLLSWVF